MNNGVAYGATENEKDPIFGALSVAQLILQREAAALQFVAHALESQQRLREEWKRALALAVNYTSTETTTRGGKIVLVGVGKSGIVARKIASTLTSVGTPAFFLHPIEGFHGDLGIINPGSDVVFAMSYSGNTPEVLAFMSLPQVQQCPRIAMTANRFGRLVQLVDVILDCSGPENLLQQENGVINTSSTEAWPPIPAPTTSTTIMMALGDAFAMSLTNAKGIDCTAFFANHPGGNLGQVGQLKPAPDKEETN